MRDPVVDQRARPHRSRPPARPAPSRLIGLALILGVTALGPVASVRASVVPAGSRSQAAPSAIDLTVTISQAAITHDAATNRADVAVTVLPTGAELPWAWSVSVRGTQVASGTTSDASVTTTVINDCSITSMSVTAQVADALGRSSSAAGTLDRSKCPPTPAYPHARDRIIAGPTLTEDSFVDRLRAVGSPALKEGRAIYRTLVDGGVNPAFALAMFHAESHSGTRGYAVVTRNWGNILFYEWEIAYGATPYKPGNGYTYAKYPSWLASVRAYVALLQRYQTNGYRTVSSASARWLGTIEGSDRHLIYLTNIVAVMNLLPDDAVPRMTGLAVPASGRAAVTISWSARDNLAVTGYQVKWRKGAGAWSPAKPVTARSTTLTLTSGPWTIAVRATDAAGNWSGWRSDTVRIDAGVPVMTGLRASQALVTSIDGRFTATWSATDAVGVTSYQWRTRQLPDGTPSAPRSTTARSGAFRLGAGTWSLEVRARDAVGNASPWRTVRVLVPRDDRAFAFSAGTTRRTAATAYHGTLTTTTVRGAELAAACADCSAVVVLGRVGPRYGKFEVTVDGATTVVDAGYFQTRRATRTHDRVLLFSARLAPGPHTVTIHNLATSGRPTLALDGLGFLR
jgi:hypothetical protein